MGPFVRCSPGLGPGIHVFCVTFPRVNTAGNGAEWVELIPGRWLRRRGRLIRHTESRSRSRSRGSVPVTNGSFQSSSPALRWDFLLWRRRDGPISAPTKAASDEMFGGRGLPFSWKKGLALPAATEEFGPKLAFLKIVKKVWKEFKLSPRGKWVSFI